MIFVTYAWITYLAQWHKYRFFGASICKRGSIQVSASSVCILAIITILTESITASWGNVFISMIIAIWFFGFWCLSLPSWRSLRLFACLCIPNGSGLSCPWILINLFLGVLRRWGLSNSRSNNKQQGCSKCLKYAKIIFGFCLRVFEWFFIIDGVICLSFYQMLTYLHV